MLQSQPEAAALAGAVTWQRRLATFVNDPG